MSNNNNSLSRDSGTAALSRLMQAIDSKDGAYFASAGQPGARSGQSQQRASDELPAWIQTQVTVISTKMPRPKDREWTGSDARDYGRQFVGLTPEQGNQLVMLLRDNYDWLPTVAEFRRLRNKMLGVIEGQGHEVDARRVIRAPRLESHHLLLEGETPEQVRERRSLENEAHRQSILSFIRQRIKEDGPTPPPSASVGKVPSGLRDRSLALAIDAQEEAAGRQELAAIRAAVEARRKDEQEAKEVFSRDPAQYSDKIDTESPATMGF